MKVRCLVIDDEKNSRENNANLAATYCPELEVIGMASKAGEGLSLINELKPDAIFLDVRMPDFDGFTLLARLGEHKPMVVFVTAYENTPWRGFSAA